MPPNTRGLIRPHQSKLALLQRVSDSVIVVLALVAAAGAHHVGMNTAYWLASLLAVIAFQLAAEATQLYTSWRVYSIRRELSVLALACISVGVVLVIIGFLTKVSTQYSRVAMVLWLLFAYSGIAAERVIMRTLLRASRARGRNTRTLAIAGIGDLALAVAERVKAMDSLGLRLIGYFDDRATVRPTQISGTPPAVAGDFRTLVQLAKEGTVDYIYVALPLTNLDRVTRLIQDLSDTTASVFFVPDLFVFQMFQARWTEIGGLPIVSVFETPFLGVDGILKRIEDLVIATGVILITAPLMLVIALGVKFSSPGPVLFRQRRYGLSGKVVEIWKFRTMRVQQDGDQIPQACRNDPRVTPFGAILRRTSLDELPQFFNVLQGHMSVIGPRPHAVTHNEQYRKLVAGYMLRHKVKPGITGWAQVNGWRGETDTLEKMKMRVEHDMYYIRNWSLTLDLKILLLTIVRGFVHPKAY